MKADDPLDRIDRKILRVLQAEGRLTNQALALRVGLSPSACLARVRRLEQGGAIQGYHARLDPYRLDIGLVLLVEVTLAGHRPHELEQFEAMIEAVPQIVEASYVSGGVDYVLKVVVADMAEWTRLKQELSEGTERITTHVLMRKPKVFVGYPVLDR
jgi:DNA-binding Lrp family transcriptional regulator